MSKDKERMDMFQENYKTMTKTEVMAQYEADFRDFLEAVSSVPEEHQNDQIIGQWKMKEILDHMASWDIETMRAIEKIMEGGTPWFFDHQDEVDRFNREQIESRKQMSTSDVLAEIQTNHQKLIDFLKNLPENLFHQSFGRKWHQQEVTPALVCSYGHYATHQRDILEFSKRMSI